LAESPYLENLASLNLELSEIGDAGAKALAASPYLENRTSLNLWGNPIREEWAKALAESAYLKKLTAKSWLVQTLNPVPWVWFKSAWAFAIALTRILSSGAPFPTTKMGLCREAGCSGC
jgi:hypothetical protein